MKLRAKVMCRGLQICRRSVKEEKISNFKWKFFKSQTLISAGNKTKI